MTTHSPVVIRELTTADIFAVRSVTGTTKVCSVAAAKDFDTVQAHLRRSPDAFLARRVLVGEGRTEQGLLRGLDNWWTQQGQDSFALRGAIPIDGGGNPNAPVIAEHLLDLGYDALLLVDTDEPVSRELINEVKQKGGKVCEWEGGCSTEERIFLDVPWGTVNELLKLAADCLGVQSVKDTINAVCAEQRITKIDDLTLPPSLDTDVLRRAIGKAAKNKNTPWFKDISSGERVGEIVAPSLGRISAKPLALTISSVRQWIDA